MTIPRGPGSSLRLRAPGSGDNYKWWAFSAIGISFFTQVMSISMVFVALAAIADDFGVTLREVSWVVVAQALTISALMMPLGRLADIVGRRRVHLLGCWCTAAARSPPCSRLRSAR